MLGRKIFGYAMGIAAAAFYGLNPLFALPLYSEGMDTTSVLLLRYVTGVPIVALLCLVMGQGLKVERRSLPMLMIVGLLMGYSSLSLFQSYRYMDASIASTMLFVYPLMVAVIQSAVFHEKFTLSTGVCLLLGGTGLILLYLGKPGETLSLTGCFWVLTSALSYAIVLVAINRSSLKSMPSVKMTFWLLFFGMFIFIVQSLCNGEVVMPHNAMMLCNVLGLGLFPTAVSLICTALAIHSIGSTPAALLGVFEPVTAVICGVCFLGEHLTGRDCAGLAFILLSVTAVVAGGLRNHGSVARKDSKACQ